jgi:hypothetical protein
MVPPYLMRSACIHGGWAPRARRVWASRVPVKREGARSVRGVVARVLSGSAAKPELGPIGVRATVERRRYALRRPEPSLHRCAAVLLPLLLRVFWDVPQEARSGRGGHNGPRRALRRWVRAWVGRQLPLGAQLAHQLNERPLLRPRGALCHIPHASPHLGPQLFALDRAHRLRLAVRVVGH